MRIPPHLPALVAAALAACGGPTSSPPADGAQDVSVRVDPASAQVAPSATARFAVTVTGTADTTVAWAVVEAGGGAVDGTGLYTAPGSAGTFHVRATSRAAPGVWGAATVTVTAPPPDVTIAVSPSPAAADACTTVAFTATVTGATDRSATWSVQEAGGGSVTAAGVYTAPASAGTYHVVATSNADPSRTAVVAVAVSERIVSVAVSPQTIQVPAGGTAQFTATVTTTCGAFASTQSVNSAGQLVAR